MAPTKTPWSLQLLLGPGMPCDMANPVSVHWRERWNTLLLGQSFDFSKAFIRGRGWWMKDDKRHYPFQWTWTGKLWNSKWRGAPASHVAWPSKAGHNKGEASFSSSVFWYIFSKYSLPFNRDVYMVRQHLQCDKCVRQASKSDSKWVIFRGCLETSLDRRPWSARQATRVVSGQWARPVLVPIHQAQTVSAPSAVASLCLSANLLQAR